MQAQRDAFMPHDVAAPESRTKGPAPATGLVAVAAGSGLRRILESLGVHGIVAGGQTMNPSTEEMPGQSTIPAPTAS